MPLHEGNHASLKQFELSVGAKWRGPNCPWMGADVSFLRPDNSFDNSLELSFLFYVKLISNLYKNP